MRLPLRENNSLLWANILFADATGPWIDSHHFQLHKARVTTYGPEPQCPQALAAWSGQGCAILASMLLCKLALNRAVGISEHTQPCAAALWTNREQRLLWQGSLVRLKARQSTAAREVHVLSSADPCIHNFYKQV